MDVLTLYRRTTGAANSLSGLLEISRLQNYGRLDEKTAEMAMHLIARDTESEEIIFRDFDAVIAGVAELRAEILARRAAAAVTK